jgi:hypothetical protein
MMKINRRYPLALLAAGLLGLAGIASAEDAAAVNDAAQANNPLLRAKAFNVHDYYIGDLTDIDEDANQFWLRFAMPFSIGDTKWLMRASLLAVNTVPAAPELEHETGLGDFNVFAAYQMDVGIQGSVSASDRCSTFPPRAKTPRAAASGRQASRTCCSARSRRYSSTATC